LLDHILSTSGAALRQMFLTTFEDPTLNLAYQHLVARSFCNQNLSLQFDQMSPS
jgi:hypothetical protein